jgi:hypothetical protein
MPVFKDLSRQEKDQLIRFPVYISLLAASKDYLLDRKEKHSVVHLTHIKTFACDPVLADYYAEVDKDFESAIFESTNRLPQDKEQREIAIKRELGKLENLLRKLDVDYAIRMRYSLRAYKDHVSKAHRNVLEYFLFPLPIGGITD